jgi:hypothetical protein
MGDQRELCLVDEQPGQEAPYERLLGDAMAGDPTLFTREDAVEAAWAVVDPVLKTHYKAIPYKRGSWGPKEAAALIERDGGWRNPSSGPPGVKNADRNKISTAGRPESRSTRESVSAIKKYTMLHKGADEHLGLQRTNRRHHERA